VFPFACTAPLVHSSSHPCTGPLLPSAHSALCRHPHPWLALTLALTDSDPKPYTLNLHPQPYTLNLHPQPLINTCPRILRLSAQPPTGTSPAHPAPNTPHPRTRQPNTRYLQKLSAGPSPPICCCCCRRRAPRTQRQLPAGLPRPLAGANASEAVVTVLEVTNICLSASRPATETQRKCAMSRERDQEGARQSCRALLAG